MFWFTESDIANLSDDIFWKLWESYGEVVKHRIGFYKKRELRLKILSLLKQKYLKSEESRDAKR